MNEYELYEKIDAYLRGDLKPEDKKAFEAEMANNPQLAEQVAMHRFEWDGMEVILENDLRGKMGQWQQEAQQLATTPSVNEGKKSTLCVEKGGAKIRRLYYSLAIAASVTVLVGVLLWVFTNPKPVNDVVKNDIPKDTIARLPLPTPVPKSNKDNMRIVEIDKKPIDSPLMPKKQENPTPIVPNNEIAEGKTYIAYAEEAYQKNDIPSYEDISRSIESSNRESVLDVAGKAYDKKDFNKVISLLKNTLAIDENFIALEILAHSYFQSKNYKAALPVFQNLLQLSGRKSQEKSEWYLLLCYLANYKTYQKSFKTLSEKIMRNQEHTYFDATKNLQEIVEKK